MTIKAEIQIVIRFYYVKKYIIQTEHDDLGKTAFGKPNRLVVIGIKLNKPQQHNKCRI